MSARPPVHPALVHLPLGLALALPPVSAAVALGWWLGHADRSAWFVVVALHAVLVLGCVAGMRSGTRARDVVRDVVEQQHLCRHRRAGQRFTLGALLSAAVAGVGTFGAGVAALSAALSGVVLVVALVAGRTGGALVFEHGAAAAYTGSAGSVLPDSR